MIKVDEICMILVYVVYVRCAIRGDVGMNHICGSEVCTITDDGLWRCELYA